MCYMISLTWIYERTMGRRKKNLGYDVYRIFKGYEDTAMDF